MQIKGNIGAGHIKKSPPQAVSPGPRYEISRSVASDIWQKTDVIHDTDEIFVQRDFHARTQQHDPEVVAAFGTPTPHSGDALLHYAGPAKHSADGPKTPVLLVHGANKTGNFFWDPSQDGADKGLAQRLRDEGHETYAITFAHNQDDNFLWAEQIANAIAEIKKNTGSEKVDLVAHSKGGQAARLYTSDVRKDGVESTAYQNDVRRLVLVGAPNNGNDYVFRHPSANYALLQGSNDHALNAPTSWEKKGVYPFLQDVSKLGYSQDAPDYFPGQRQLLSNLSGEFHLSPSEPDWYTTYHGGTGFVSESKGIEHYIQEGGNLVERLNQHPPDPNVEVAVLAGNRANIPGILNEYTGPSDGIVFVSSALTMPEKTNIIKEEVLPLHHLALIADEKGQDWILDALDRSETSKKTPDLKKLVAEASADWQAHSNVEATEAKVSSLKMASKIAPADLTLLTPMV